jgi:hypothetical protein
MSRTHRSVRLEADRRRQRANAERIARADLLVCIVCEALDTAQPLRAGTARVAIDELRAMVSAGADQSAQALPAADVERLARAAGLPEVEALDYRRNVGQPMTEPELHAWRRIERFAALVAAEAVTASSDSDPSKRTPGAGPVAAT